MDQEAGPIPPRAGNVTVNSDKLLSLMGANVFAPAIGRDELIGRRLRDVAAKLCGGSLTPLLTHLVEAEPLTARERETLRGLIDRLADDPTTKRRGPRG